MMYQSGILYQVSDNDINYNGTFTFPDEIIGIGSHCFADCKTLKKIVIPNRLITIDEFAFSHCTNLETVMMTNSVSFIGTGAFYHCAKLKEIIIPDNITRIEPVTFADCFNLEKIKLPYSITSICNNAFLNCEMLKTQKNVYKAFSSNFKCKNYQFKIDKHSRKVLFPKLCKRGYHYCTSLPEIFNYYSGDYDKDFFICICEPGTKIKTSDSSKCVTDTIKPVRKLTREEMIDIINGKEI